MAKKKEKKQSPKDKCPVGTQVQTLIFDREKFTRTRSKAWAKKHEFKFGKIDETEDYFRIRQQNPDKMDENSFRTIEFGEGITAVIGCPKKKMEGGGSVNSSSEPIQAQQGAVIQPRQAFETTLAGRYWGAMDTLARVGSELEKKKFKDSDKFLKTYQKLVSIYTDNIIALNENFESGGQIKPDYETIYAEKGAVIVGGYYPKKKESGGVVYQVPPPPISMQSPPQPQAPMQQPIQDVHIQQENGGQVQPDNPIDNNAQNIQ
jgi:hypothetical protein